MYCVYFDCCILVDHGGKEMSIKYFKQNGKEFENITLEEFNLLERLRKQKIKDEEEWKKQRREKEMEGNI